jgi:hypothetical protein
VVPESRLAPTERGLVPEGDGWFVLNAREARWLQAPGRGSMCLFEGEERRLRQWDFAHCPAGTDHVIVGAGDVPCLMLAVGARVRSTGPDWGRYTVHAAALRHGAGVEQQTTDPEQAYARFPSRELVAYREGWLPG